MTVLARAGQIAFAATGGDIFLLVKGPRVDLCFELTSRFLVSLKSYTQSSHSVSAFKYLLGQVHLCLSACLWEAVLHAPHALCVAAFRI